MEQAAIFYAGWLGHYVGDASQPLHTTVQYNGWTGPNPNGYTTAHTIHWQFEGPFVGANLHASDIQPRMTPAHAIEGDVFTDYMAYLRQTSKYIEKVYQLEKNGGFEGQGTPGIARFHGRSTRRRRQHASRHDLFGVAAERQSGSGPACFGELIKRNWLQQP